MITAYFGQHEIHNREREITRNAERRRLAADGAPESKGDRLGFLAVVARLARPGKRPTVAHPSC
jgi:hypothetical protein